MAALCTDARQVTGILTGRCSCLPPPAKSTGLEDGVGQGTCRWRRDGPVRIDSVAADPFRRRSAVSKEPAGYGRNWKKWLLIYLVVGVIVYGLVYLLFFSNGY